MGLAVHNLVDLASRPRRPNHPMKRREFMVAFAGALAGAARLAAAQGRVPHLAFPWLGAAGSGGDALKGLLSGLRDLGYQEGRNLVIDYYYAGGKPARLAELATAAVALHPDVIVTLGGLTTTALAKATRNDRLLYGSRYLVCNRDRWVSLFATGEDGSERAAAHEFFNECEPVHTPNPP